MAANTAKVGSVRRGYLRGPLTAAMWKLNLGELRWERMHDVMHDLMRGRAEHACCAVRGGFVVLGGTFEGQAGGLEATASVEISGYDSDAQEHIFRALPPLTRGVVYQSVAVAIEESASELGQVLLIGGQDEDDEMSSAVHLVDLATGVCTAQSRLVSSQGYLGGCSAARLLDGRIVCLGEDFAQATLHHTAQVLEPPTQGSESEASWQCRYLPSMSVGHIWRQRVRAERRPLRRVWRLGR